MPNYIKQEATNAFSIPTHNAKTPLKHFFAPVMHPITVKSITNQNKLAKDPATMEVWNTAFGTESGNFSQGDI